MLVALGELVLFTLPKGNYRGVLLCASSEKISITF
ncbi:hypothetical protein B6N60_02921 [Richelia sinica FACHB-800]|uniref:Uncharacterized protein n=1 Tax=Richelia sinica FACHB-800 TaxID=1357546 RepID=A0A975T8P7_9NOST|nr:hypothetical protein B6N60_02921 [Richelia sinica FACHB-800]